MTTSGLALIVLIAIVLSIGGYGAIKALHEYLAKKQNKSKKSK